MRKRSRSSAAPASRASSGLRPSNSWTHCRKTRWGKSCARSCMRKTKATPKLRRPRREPTLTPSSLRRKGAEVKAARADAGAIEIELAGGALLATLQRPQAHNRVTHAMARELIDLTETVEDDDSILALALTGAGS